MVDRLGGVLRHGHDHSELGVVHGGGRVGKLYSGEGVDGDRVYLYVCICYVSPGWLHRSYCFERDFRETALRDTALPGKDCFEKGLPPRGVSLKNLAAFTLQKYIRDENVAAFTSQGG